MQRLCRITVPGLSIERDFTAARRRLMDEFPNIEEVVATTAPGTLMVLSTGPEDVDGWLEALRGAGAKRRTSAPRRLLGLRRRRVPGDDFAA
jgi:hypothetical protein